MKGEDFFALSSYELHLRLVAMGSQSLLRALLSIQEQGYPLGIRIQMAESPRWDWVFV